MEGLSFIKLVEFLTPLGLPGILLAVWYLNERSRSSLLETYRQDQQALIQKYGEDVKEVRAMYERNVSLVQSYEELAKDLKDVVIMNTQAMTKALDSIENNQFCPHVRLKKEAEGVQG